MNFILSSDLEHDGVRHVVMLLDKFKDWIVIAPMSSRLALRQYCDLAMAIFGSVRTSP